MKRAQKDESLGSDEASAEIRSSSGPCCPLPLSPSRPQKDESLGRNVASAEEFVGSLLPAAPKSIATFGRSTAVAPGVHRVAAPLPPPALANLAPLAGTTTASWG